MGAVGNGRSDLSTALPEAFFWGNGCVDAPLKVTIGVGHSERNGFD